MVGMNDERGVENVGVGGRECAPNVFCARTRHLTVVWGYPCPDSPSDSVGCKVDDDSAIFDNFSIRTTPNSWRRGQIKVFVCLSFICSTATCGPGAMEAALEQRRWAFLNNRISSTTDQ